jgi:4-hydroxyphenylpyruvate dioxygenase-like putative hemolysin
MRLAELVVLTRDADAAAAAWAKASRLEAEKTSAEARMAVGGVVIRLVTPSHDSHVAGLLEQRGEGMFDFAIEVDDLEGTVAQLRDKGVNVTDAMDGEGGRRQAVIDPASAHGVPIRLLEKQ